MNWIKVSERLPEDGEEGIDVLVFYKGTSKMAADTMSIEHTPFEIDHDMGPAVTWEATHWMPLPDPPKDLQQSQMEAEEGSA